MDDFCDSQRTKNMMVGDPEEEESQLEEAIERLESWKVKSEKAEDEKSRLVLEKLKEDDARTAAKKEMMFYLKQQEDCEKEITQSFQAVQNEISNVGKRRRDILDKLNRCRVELEAKRSEAGRLRQKFKIYIEVPQTEVKFSHQQDVEDNDGQFIRGVFTISQRPSLHLQEGQAVLTFEEARVASQILKIPKCSVCCDNGTLTVKPQKIYLDPAVKFEVHLNVSRRELKVFNVFSSMSEERIVDRLEMSFSRPSRGGGEVERVDYDRKTGMGLITFLHPRVAESLALKGSYQVDLECVKRVKTGLVYHPEMHRFQTFCGSPKRTILLNGIEDLEAEEELQDQLEIHFQKPSNCGGEIEHIKYTSRGTPSQVFFLCEDVEKMDD